VERSGMIQEPVVGRVHFVHRTFEEFLAAKAAMDAGDIGLLIDKADDDQWWEVIILAAGHAGQKDREALIQGLIRRGDKERSSFRLFKNRNEPLSYQLYLLAVNCLEASVDLSPETAEEVQKRLVELVPPRDMQTALALSQAGELAVPYLKYDENYSSETVHACVQALIQIGGDAAVEVLNSYMRERPSQAVQALSQAGESAILSLLQTGSDAAFEVVNGYMREKPSQAVEALIQAGELAVPYLKYDEKYDSKTVHAYVQALIQIGGDAMIEVLKVYTKERSGQVRPQLFDAVGVIDRQSYFKNILGRLDFQSLDLLIVSSLEGFEHLTSLTSLSLKGMTQVRDLNSLSSLKNLTSLALSGMAQVRDLSPLSLLKKLTALSLRGWTRTIDLSPLSSLTSLTFLSLRGGTQVRDLSPLSSLANLKSLVLSGSVLVRDLSPLTKISTLEKVHIIGRAKGIKVPKKLSEHVDVRFR